MAKAGVDLTASVGKLLGEQDGNVLREVIQVQSRALMESEVAGLIGANLPGTEPSVARGRGRGRGIRGSGRSSWRISSCGVRRTSRRSCSPAGVRIRRCLGWFMARTYAPSRPAR